MNKYSNIGILGFLVFFIQVSPLLKVVASNYGYGLQGIEVVLLFLMLLFLLSIRFKSSNIKIGMKLTGSILIPIIIYMYIYIYYTLISTYSYALHRLLELCFSVITLYIIVIFFKKHDVKSYINSMFYFSLLILLLLIKDIFIHNNVSYVWEARLQYGLIFGFLLLVSIDKLFRVRFKTKIIYAIIIIFSIYSLVITNNRGALLAALTTLIFYIFSNAKNIYIKLIISLIIIYTGVISFGNLDNDYQRNRLSTIDFSSRADLFENSLNIISNNIFGSGVASSGILIGVGEKGFPHNFILEAAIDTGWLGAFVLIFFLYRFSYCIISTLIRFNTNNSNIKLTFLIFIFVFINMSKSYSLSDIKLLLIPLGVCLVSVYYFFYEKRFADNGTTNNSNH